MNYNKRVRHCISSTRVYSVTVILSKVAKLHFGTEHKTHLGLVGPRIQVAKHFSPPPRKSFSVYAPARGVLEQWTSQMRGCGERQPAMMPRTRAVYKRRRRSNLHVFNLGTDMSGDEHQQQQQQQQRLLISWSQRMMLAVASGAINKLASLTSIQALPNTQLHSTCLASKIDFNLQQKSFAKRSILPEVASDSSVNIIQ